MRLKREKKKKMEENRLMGEDPEYEYEWNNFAIVQVIDLEEDDENIEEAVKTQKQEVHYSNLLEELDTGEKRKMSSIEEESEERPQEEQEKGVVKYKCHFCFKQIPANEFNEHYKEELKKKELQEMEVKEKENQGEKEKKEGIGNNLQNYLKGRKAKMQDDILFKKKDKPDFLK